MIKAPKEYLDFIEKYGIYSKDGIEIFGLKDGIDNSKIPSVIGATEIYKKHYKIDDNEFVIFFDDIENTPIVLTPNNEIYRVYFDKREKIANSFNEWFEEIKDLYE